MRGIHRAARWLIFALPLLAVLVADAQRAEAQWQLGAGIASIHSGSRTGGFIAGGFLRSLDGPGRLQLGGHASIGTADEGYTTLEVDAQVHPTPSAQVSPFVGVQAGVLAEPEFSGGVFTGIAGIVVPMRPSRSIRIVGGWATHGDTPGPHFLLVALEFGRRTRS